MSIPRTAVVAGASGYIGGHLTESLAASGWAVRTIGRDRADDAPWTDRQQLVNVLEGADLLVNLAGRSVSCRYNKRNADAIFSSRVDTTAALGSAVAQTRDGPRLWINASTGTIYRDSRDQAMDEDSGEIGTGFSVAVARAWEHELFSAPGSIRKVALRMSIVLGAGGGAINALPSDERRTHGRDTSCGGPPSRRSDARLAPGGRGSAYPHRGRTRAQEPLGRS